MTVLLIMGLVFGLTLASQANAGTTGPPDSCQTKGPVTVCSSNDFGYRYVVIYRGYLVGGAKFSPCRPDFAEESNVKMGGSLNGIPFNDDIFYGSCELPGSLSSSFEGTGHQATHVELYFFDDQGQYDSIYGENYQFDFY